MNNILLKNKTNLKDIIIPAVISVFLFFMGTFNITHFGIPVVLMDEFGYLSDGAYFAGYDWSGVGGFNAYYSYGAGIIPALAFKIFKNSQYAYRFIIVFNSLLLVLMFFLSKNILNIVFPNKDKTVLDLVAMISVCTPTAFANSHLAWSETLQTFVFWLSTFFTLKFITSQKRIWIYLAMICYAFEYAVHQRCISLIVSGIVFIVFSAIFKKVKFLDIAIMILIIGCLWFVHSTIKSNLKSDLYASKIPMNDLSPAVNLASKNDWQGVEWIFYFWKIKGFFPELLIGSIGKICSLMLTTFCFWGIGMVGVFKKLLHRMISDIKQKKLEITNQELFYIFVFCIESAALMVSILACMFPTRYDVLVYGRYIEWVQGIMMALGIVFFLENENKKRIGFICISLLFVFSKILTTYYYQHAFTQFLWSCCGGLLAYFNLSGNSPDYLIVASLIVSIVFIVCILVSNKLNRTNSHRIIASILILSCVFISACVYKRMEDSNYRYDWVMEIDSKIDSSKDIYFVDWDTQNLWYVASIQFLNRDANIECISEEPSEWHEKGEGDFYIICDGRNSRISEYQEYADIVEVNTSAVKIFYLPDNSGVK